MTTPTDHDTDAAAAQLGMSGEWLRKRVKADNLPHQKYGRSIRFTDEQIAAIRAFYAAGAPTTTAASSLRPSSSRRSTRRSA